MKIKNEFSILTVDKNGILVSDEADERGEGRIQMTYKDWRRFNKWFKKNKKKLLAKPKKPKMTTVNKKVLDFISDNPKISDNPNKEPIAENRQLIGDSGTAPLPN